MWNLSFNRYFIQTDRSFHRTRIHFHVVLILISIMIPYSSFAASAAQDGDRPIGRLISSDPVSIEGRTAWSSGTDTMEEPTPLIFTANKLSLAKGIALLELSDSQGVVGFCGRTQVSLFKSKSVLMYALQEGTLSIDVTSTVEARIMTPQFVVEWKPATQPQRMQGVVRLDVRGGLCVQSIAGKMKITDQLTGQQMGMDSGLSVSISSDDLTTASLSRNLDCGCSSVSSAALIRRDPDLPVFGSSASSSPALTNPAAVGAPEEAAATANSSNASLPGTPVPAVNVTPASAAAVSSTPSAPAPQTAADSPAPSKASTPAPEQPVTSGTFAVSAENLPRRPNVKQSFGARVKSFFHRIFSRKHPQNS